MHSQQSGEEDNNVLVFHKKDEKRMVLQKTSQKNAEENAKNSILATLINNHVDQSNRAEPQICSVEVTHNVQFRNYFTKNKNKGEKQKVFDQLRNLLIERGYNQISQIRDREEVQIMVVRVVSKLQNALNTVIIEDQSSKDKLVIKEGIVWVGMICAIKARWNEGSYKLQSIIDLSKPIPQIKAHLSVNMSVNRIMFVKGPFRPKYSNQDEGIRMIIYELKKLKKKNIMINELVIMGPLISKNNNLVQNFALDKTYEQQYEQVLVNLKNQLNQISSEILIYVMPALEDVTSLYPIPQPAYVSQNKKIKVKYLSNPASLKIQGRRSVCKIDLINYDVLKCIDTLKTGKNTKQLRQQNLQTFIKQPFYLSNTTTSQDPFDQVNISQLYNNGNFGDLVVFSSIQNPPFINQVNGRIVLNIGSLGVETNFTGKNYIAFASIYEGDGPASQRIKIQTITSG